jgi:Domain of unknown function (DUF4340)
MNAKRTWTWFAVAAALFAFIFFFERHWRQPAPGPEPVLPNLKAAAVTSVQVYPAGEFEIRAERTNQMWFLTKPIEYPAQAARIEALLTTLEQLTPVAPPLTAHDLRRHPNAEVEYGLENPQATLVLRQDHYSRQLRFGKLTAPGDQVFMRIVGVDGIYVVDADLLKLIPHATNDWRDTTFMYRGGPLVFDRLVVTNATKVIEFQRDTTNNTWRMTYPLKVRADSTRLNNSLRQLGALQVTQFVSDNAGADLETYGLRPAELELILANGTNPVAHLFFGKTNAAGQVFAKRQSLPGIVAVNGEPLVAWRASVNDFRDRHLISLPKTLGPVEVRGEDHFTLLPQTNGWQISPQNFPVDAQLAADFLATLVTVQIDFYKNAVTEPDLSTNGLLKPAHSILLKTPATESATNTVLAQLSFGITNDNKVLVARTDEDSIYALPLADFQRLPWASWQLRERRIWKFTEHDVTKISIRQGNKTREILRHGTNSWTLAPGSQGVINSFAIEEATHEFGELSKIKWVDHAPKDLQRYGITTNSLSLTFELKNGQKCNIEFGSLAPSHYPYAVVTLDQQTWVFEFPVGLYTYVSTYLTPTSNTP